MIVILDRNIRSNESGVTLLEVLAAVSILMLFSGLTYGVMINTMKFNENSQSHVNLRQEANIIVSTLREKYKDDEFSLCYQDLINEQKVSFYHITLQNVVTEINAHNPCDTINTNYALKVDFTLSDNLNNRFQINTIIGGEDSLVKDKEISIDVPLFATEPEEEDYYDIIRNENVFVASQNFEFAGSTINGTNSTMLIKGDLLGSKINGGSLINVSNIYVDGNINVDGGSAGLGSQTHPGVIVVSGNLNLWNGTRPIYGNVYVDGNMRLKDGILNGNAYVNKNLELGWTPNIVGNSKIYYSGSLTHPNNYSQSVLSKVVKQTPVPRQEMIKYDIPPLKSDQWFLANGYNQSVSPNNMKLFGNNLSVTSGNISGHGYVSTFNNAVIISKGDVTIRGGDLVFSGVVIAPYGSVTFEGRNFEGTVLSRDGFFVKSGGTNITFKNIQNYIKNKNESPFLDN